MVGGNLDPYYGELLFYFYVAVLYKLRQSKRFVTRIVYNVLMLWFESRYTRNVLSIVKINKFDTRSAIDGRCAKQLVTNDKCNSFCLYATDINLAIVLHICKLFKLIQKLLLYCNWFLNLIFQCVHGGVSFCLNGMFN